MDPLAGIPINTLTAGPLLRLMLAMEGMEPDSMPVEEAWPVFKRFAALPSQANGDVISFQVRQEGEPGSPMYYCMWIRQLSDEAGEGRTDSEHPARVHVRPRSANPFLRV